METLPRTVQAKGGRHTSPVGSEPPGRQTSEDVSVRGAVLGIWQGDRRPQGSRRLFLKNRPLPAGSSLACVPVSGTRPWNRPTRLGPTQCLIFPGPGRWMRQGGAGEPVPFPPAPPPGGRRTGAADGAAARNLVRPADPTRPGAIASAKAQALLLFFFLYFFISHTH